MVHKESHSKNLIKQLAFYGAYHSHPMNQLIHVIFVPVIWWSAIILVCHTGPLISTTLTDIATNYKLSLPDFITQNVVFDLGFFAYLFYVIYYLSLGDYFVALPYNAILTLMYLNASWVYQSYGSDAWKIALVGQILGWVMQVTIGHNVFEGKKPALLDSLFDALVMAPLFTWYETLFFFGIRQNLKKEINAEIGRMITNKHHPPQSNEIKGKSM